MNANPIHLAAILAFLAVCATGNALTNAKMAEVKTPPAVTPEAAPTETGLNSPGQSSYQAPIRPFQDLNQALQNAKTRKLHPLYQTDLTKKIRLEVFCAIEEGSNRKALLPVVRLAW
jgi:hypothetical protein